MATQPKAFVTPDQYLAAERAAGTRSEYHNGEIFARVGASLARNRIVINLVRELGNALRARDCEVFSSEMRVSISSGAAYAYPDVLVVCGKPIFTDDQADTLTNPVVLIEVDYDRGGKFYQYRRIPSFQEYLTVSQTEILVDHSVRQPNNTWLLREIGPSDGSVSLSTIGVELKLAAIYERVLPTGPTQT